MLASSCGKSRHISRMQMKEMIRGALLNLQKRLKSECNVWVHCYTWASFRCRGWQRNKETSHLRKYLMSAQALDKEKIPHECSTAPFPPSLSSLSLCSSSSTMSPLLPAIMQQSCSVAILNEKKCKILAQIRKTSRLIKAARRVPVTRIRTNWKRGKIRPLPTFFSH